MIRVLCPRNSLSPVGVCLYFHWLVSGYRIVVFTTHCLCVCLFVFCGSPRPPVCLSCGLCLFFSCYWLCVVCLCFGGSLCLSVCLSCDLCLCCFGVGLGVVCVRGLHSCLNLPDLKVYTSSSLQTNSGGSPGNNQIT